MHSEHAKSRDPEQDETRQSVVDGYDQLMSQAEAEVDELRQGWATGARMGIGPDNVLRVRRRIVDLQHGLVAEREGEYAKDGAMSLRGTAAGVVLLAAVSAAVLLFERGRRWL